MLTEDWHQGGGDDGPTGDWQVIRELPNAQAAVINAEAMGKWKGEGSPGGASNLSNLSGLGPPSASGICN